MSIACEFDYVKPTSWKAALEALGKEGAWALAGGSDLIAWLRDGAVQPEVVVDLKGLDGMKGIGREGGALRLAGGTTFAEVLESEAAKKAAPVLWEAAGMVASGGVRNRATVAGNVCSAVPCCDAGPALLVHGAVMEVRTKGGKKEIPIEQWFKGPRKTALPKGAIVAGIRIPAGGGKHGGAFAKLKRYRGEDLAQASVAAWVDGRGNWRIALGSVGPVPYLAVKTAAVLKGCKAPDETLLAKAAAVAEEEARPITDIRSSETYRRLMVGVMVKRAAALAAKRLAGEGPEYGMNCMEEEAE